MKVKDPTSILGLNLLDTDELIGFGKPASADVWLGILMLELRAESACWLWLLFDEEDGSNFLSLTQYAPSALMLNCP